jgi:hypothetical protein
VVFFDFERSGVARQSFKKRIFCKEWRGEIGGIRLIIWDVHLNWRVTSPVSMKKWEAVPIGLASSKNALSSSQFVYEFLGYKTLQI